MVDRLAEERLSAMTQWAGAIFSVGRWGGWWHMEFSFLVTAYLKVVHWSVRPYVYTFFFFSRLIYLSERKHTCTREPPAGRGEGWGKRRILSRFPLSAKPPRRAQYHDPEIMIWAAIKSQTFNGLSHTGVPDKITVRKYQKLFFFSDCKTREVFLWKLLALWQIKSFLRMFLVSDILPSSVREQQNSLGLREK